ncbi:hypothetical protein Pmani_034002 [Petrolisthes manimaculis]|nr:hypothetical protein Pmani_034002 [Petrolisthes manimaculis]
MDTTNFFKYGQKHELRISLPKTNKSKQKDSNNSSGSGETTRILKNGYNNNSNNRGTPEVVKEVRFALDERDTKGKRGDSEGNLSEGSSTMNQLQCMSTASPAHSSAPAQPKP